MPTVTLDRAPTSRRRRAALIAAALLALVLPSCGSDSGTLPDVFAAVIQVTVEPNPIIGAQNQLTGSVSATYRITIDELGRTRGRGPVRQLHGLRPRHRRAGCPELLRQRGPHRVRRVEAHRAEGHARRAADGLIHPARPHQGDERHRHRAGEGRPGEPQHTLAARADPVGAPFVRARSPASCSTRRRCPAATASATWVPRRRRSSTSSPRPGQRLWQVLPLGPTGYGDSPYQCFSAFAGNPLLISLDLLRDEGSLAAADLAAAPAFPERRGRLRRGDRLQAPRCSRARSQRFERRAAAPRAGPRSSRSAPRTRAWLDGLRALHGRSRTRTAARPWHAWDRALVRARAGGARPGATRAARARSAQVEFVQLLFFGQWPRCARRPATAGIGIIGDMPIFVAHDSADVWAHPELFQLDADGRPAVVAGVPPDYFSATGQLLGQPALPLGRARARPATPGGSTRFRAVLALVDLVRLDHFRGFEAYWEVPGDATTAVARPLGARAGRGVLRGAPRGARRAADRRRGPRRDHAGGRGAARPLRLPGHGGPAVRVRRRRRTRTTSCRTTTRRNSVVYTGTHDNDTVVGLVDERGRRHDTYPAGGRPRARARARLPRRRRPRDPLGLDPRCCVSVADTAIVAAAGRARRSAARRA